MTTPAIPQSLLAALNGEDELVCVRDGPDLLVACRPAESLRADGDDALGRLRALAGGWWAGWLSYDLGRSVEHVRARHASAHDMTDVHLARFDARVRLRPGVAPVVEGGGPVVGVLEDALERAGSIVQVEDDGIPLDSWSSSFDRGGFMQAVERIQQHLRDGDCYQVNLTRRLTAATSIDPMALWARLDRSHPAPHAAFVRLGDTSVVSASPELFLRRDGEVIETRPIKGTAADAATLAHSAKDRAENVMIVDLARNDLGRVCRYGTVEVPSLCALEQHPGLHHLVSTVRGRLRPQATPGDIVAATFPPASVTGAPKPRVLQIIEDLEPVPRGVYCGAVGFLDTERDRWELNVAIRTFVVTADAVTFGVGGGIVIDSSPGAEWDETELKAARLLAVAAGQTSR